MPMTTADVDPQLPTVTAESPAATAHDPEADAATELRRQLQVYLDLGYPELLGLPPETLHDQVSRLSQTVAPPAVDGPPEDHVPMVLVLDPGAGSLVDRVPGMRRGPRRGVSVIDDAEARTYRDQVPVPAAGAYVLTAVDVGARYVNMPPEAALQRIVAQGRSPLTIAEGLALVTVRPDMLRPNRCFSLAGSRTGTNQRVPAVWISDRRPKLGWCWDRNPHTWLGTASTAGRTAA